MQCDDILVIFQMGGHRFEPRGGAQYLKKKNQWLKMIFFYKKLFIIIIIIISFYMIAIISLLSLLFFFLNQNGRVKPRADKAYSVTATRRDIEIPIMSSTIRSANQEEEGCARSNSTPGEHQCLQVARYTQPHGQMDNLVMSYISKIRKRVYLSLFYLHNKLETLPSYYNSVQSVGQNLAIYIVNQGPHNIIDHGLK